MSSANIPEWVTTAVTVSERQTSNTSDEAQGLGDSQQWVSAYWSSFIEHPQAQQSTVFGHYLRLLVLPVILLAGFLGNALTITLMARPAMRRHSYSPYLMALAVADSTALVVRLLFWINLLSLTLDRPVVVTFASKAACAVVEFACTVNHVLCSWLVVCMTFERLLVIALPLKSARFVSVSTSVKVVTVVVLCSFLLISYVPAVVQWVPEAGGCMVPYPRELYAHFVVATTFVSIAPLALICCGNVLIALFLYRHSRRTTKLLGRGAFSAEGPRSKGLKPPNESFTDQTVESSDLQSDPGSQVPTWSLQSSHPEKKAQPTTHGGIYVSKTSAPAKPVAAAGSDQQVRRVTFTLLVVSLSFLVLVMPNALMVLSLGLRPEWSYLLLPGLDPMALLWDVNFAINFYLYVFAGASFRAEVVKMLRCQ